MNYANVDWRPIQQKYQNSVMRVNVVAQTHDPMYPYASGSDKLTSGSSFLIDEKAGIFATNAHVVQNASSLSGTIPKFGKWKIPLELVSIIRDKDIALVRIKPSELKKVFADKDIHQFELGDNLSLNNADHVLVLGYPLGESTLKSTSGIISACFQTDENAFNSILMEDSFAREPTYITMSASINPGNSGGVMLDSEGRAVGIPSAGIANMQNIGFCIPIRVLLAHYKLMLSEQFPIIPTLSLRWSCINDDTIKYLCKGNKDLEDGILVKKILDDSIFQGLKSRDIINQISFDIPKISDKLVLKDFENNTYEKQKITAKIDSSSDIFVYDIAPELNYKNGKRLFNHPLTMPQLIDLCVVGEKIDVIFLRDKQKLKMSSNFSHVPSTRIHGVYPQFQPFEWKVVAGLCLTPLLLNQMGVLRKFHGYMGTEQEDRFMYSPHIIVTQVFPETEASKMGAIEQGDILHSINGHKIETLDDVETAVKKTKDFITFETDCGGFLALSKKQYQKDQKISEKYM